MDLPFGATRGRFLHLKGRVPLIRVPSTALTCLPLSAMLHAGLPLDFALVASQACAALSPNGRGGGGAHPFAFTATPFK